MKKPRPYSSSDLKKQILADARSLQIAEKWAETIADKTARHVDAWVKGRGAVTAADLTRIAAEKLEGLHPELAYIYLNRGKIL